MCALSAGWTGSCQPDEGEVSAVHISHPAATHRQKRTTCLCVALRTTAKEVFFMKRLKQLFKDSFRELKDTRKMAMAAMFVAIAVILGFTDCSLRNLFGSALISCRKRWRLCF